jgi:hypothetical protein
MSENITETFSSQKICPLLNKKCLGKECAWYFSVKNTEDVNIESCSIVRLSKKKIK